MGLRQQHFASLVMSVLILEDILAIVMMVMLSSVARGSNPDGGEMLGSVMRIGFFLILWFIVGISVLPMFLRATRKLINEETLLVVSLGLCCLMAVVSTQVGFSSAFGAFVMGSILAETVEAEKIIKLVEPVRRYARRSCHTCGVCRSYMRHCVDNTLGSESLRVLWLFA